MMQLNNDTMKLVSNVQPEFAWPRWLQNPGVSSALIIANEQGSMMNRHADNPHSKWNPGPHFSEGGINGSRSEYLLYSITDSKFQFS
jgi:hypothetical protein